MADDADPAKLGVVAGVDLDTTAPEDLPPFRDPLGREIWPRHRRRAMVRANKMDLGPRDANHALYLLAARGIDIIGETPQAAPDGQQQAPPAQAQNNALAAVPAAAPPAKQTRADREGAVAAIQRDLIRRRRRRFWRLMLRLCLFVGLPTAIVGWYFFFVATEMFETDSAFVIQTSDSASTPASIGGVLAGTGIATSQDSIVVQDFLGSREAFLRLEGELGYAAHFKAAEIDVVQRLPVDATLDDAYDYFKRRVTIGYDPTEGVIRMTVVAATPEMSQQFSEALISYAEERVDGLSQEARGDQLADAIARTTEAEQRMLEAQGRVLELQEQRGVLNAEAEFSSQMEIINALELEAEEKRLALAEILDNARPNTSRAAVLEREIARLDARVDTLRGELTQAGDSTVSLARISAELRIAETELATRQLILQEAIGGTEAARLEADRQVRYLSLGVAPIAPVEATYPRKIESTLLAFVVFLGIYILGSLTVAILREQVSV